MIISAHNFHTVARLCRVLCRSPMHQPSLSLKWIKKAIHICKKEQQAMNREEGSYHTTAFLAQDLLTVQEPEEEMIVFILLMKTSGEGRNVEV